jgi:hypothetical protein
MLNEVLKGLKKEACVRLDFERRDKEFKATRYSFLRRYEALFEGTDPLNFEVPEGWKRVMEVCLSSLKKLPVKITRVKQKFGDLRIYFEQLDGDAETLKEINQAITVAGFFAARTCEFCGKTEQVSLWEKSYVARVCVNCKEKLAEYWVLYCVLEDSRIGTENEKYALEGLRYARKVLQQIYSGEDITYNGSFHSLHLQLW